MYSKNSDGKRGGEQPAEHVPTEETRLIAKELFMAGIPLVRIADRLDITEVTLRKHYRAELEHNKDSRTAALASNLYQDAMSGDKQAREFWLKTQGRWSYAKPQEETDRDKKIDTLLEKLVDKL